MLFIEYRGVHRLELVCLDFCNCLFYSIFCLKEFCFDILKSLLILTDIYFTVQCHTI